MEEDYIPAELSPISFDDQPMTYKSFRSYRSHVKALCSRNPSLMSLYQFLSEPKAETSCRICAMDFVFGLDRPIIRQHIKKSQLRQEIQEEPKQEKSERREKALQGRILVIEDLSKEIIELLGSVLDIDPLFFALHLHTVRRTSSRYQTPDEATLPSRLLSQDFTNVSYHRAVVSDTAVPYKGRFLRTSKVGRKLVFLRSTQIALAQHGASVIRIKNRKGPWLALIIVDPPIDNNYTTDDADKRPVTLNLRPFLSTYEDFLPPPPFDTDYDSPPPTSPSHQGMYDDMQHYWSLSPPTTFNPTSPTIQSLSYYTLRIVAAEWVKYVAVMQFCLKQYEYNHDALPALSLDKFDQDLRELQSWRRRTMVSQGKIKGVVRFLAARRRSGAGAQHEEDDIELLTSDLEYIHTNIDTVGRRLESMLPVVMSFVQITDARRSFAETANITRLTVLALIFVPLTFVSSLFSMNSSLVELRETLWMYFALAAPLTGGVVLVARPPGWVRRGVREVGRWGKGVLGQGGRWRGGEGKGVLEKGGGGKEERGKKVVGLGMGR
ncbi:hypothetical protein EJ04DRAFT_578802 [Polyplosphaeria fusca]|uniref:Uncharacterized protein n=1 Tax=Polyplosphaeria fusca TaxID=682080 RepID=A0A9P4QSE3_9PLEO|nr:hypothetical protein EJ04DRAFT_578802 [Polyplosphaeria fusca]